MSQENVEIVRRMYQAFHSGDVDRGSVTEVGKGPEHVNAVVASWVGAWDEWREEIEEMRDVGSRVLVLSVQRGRGKGSGVEVEARYAMLYDVHGGRITTMRMFGSVAQAFEAAGLSE